MKPPDATNPTCACGKVMVCNGSRAKPDTMTKYYVCHQCHTTLIVSYDLDGNEVERRIPYEAPARSNRGGKAQTLCWTCNNAYAHKCGYHSRKHTPVEGWEVQTSITEGVECYTVLSCPNYEPDKPRRSTPW